MILAKNKLVTVLLISFCLFGTWRCGYAQTTSLQLYLTFNQPKYAPGDTAFFSGRLVSVENLKLITGKKVVSLSLLGSDGKLRLHNRIVFQNGMCANQFVVGITPDQYSLVAFIEGQTIPENSVPILNMPFLVAGERKFVNKNKEQQTVAELNSVSVSVKTDMENYEARRPVNVQVNITEVNNRPLEGDFSVSVVHADLFDSDGLFSNSSARINEAKGNSLQGNDKSMAYYFRGKVKTEGALKDSTLITFYLNRNDFVYPLYVGSTGTFEFPLFKDFSDERIYYTITHRGTKVDGTILSDAPVIKNDSLAASVIMTSEEDKYYSFAKKRNVVMKSFQYYTNRSQKEYEEEWLDSDFDIELDKFEPFSSMPELLGNIVQMVRYRKKEGEEMVRIFLKDNAIYATVDPLYIIDGVMMDNTKYFLNLLPVNIDKIGILRSHETLRRYGELGKNGIILVRTKPTSREDLPSSQHELFVTGISKSILFKSPSYAARNQINTPDLRSTLYWNPKIITDNQGKASFSFYTGDATGSFKIRIDGMTKTGKLFTKEIPFTVSYEKP